MPGGVPFSRFTLTAITVTDPTCASQMTIGEATRSGRAHDSMPASEARGESSGTSRLVSQRARYAPSMIGAMRAARAAAHAVPVEPLTETARGETL